MYQHDNTLKFDFGHLESIMEGAFRPGHFNGVATIVSKFFNIVQPHKVFLGQKDIQQVAVIRTLTEALSFQTELVIVPTLREPSGLAMSSRNQRLSKEELTKAAVIYKHLIDLQSNLLAGSHFEQIKDKTVVDLEQNYGFIVEYIELTKGENLNIVNRISIGEHTICIAAQLGSVRLIDNLTFISE